MNFRPFTGELLKAYLHLQQLATGVFSPFVIASHQLQRSLRYTTCISPSPKNPQTQTAEGGRVVSDDCQHQRLWSSSTMAHCLGDLGGEAGASRLLGGWCAWRYRNLNPSEKPNQEDTNINVWAYRKKKVTPDFTKDKWPIFWYLHVNVAGVVVLFIQPSWNLIS